MIIKIEKIICFVVFIGVAYMAGAEEIQNTKLKQFASFDGVEGSDYCEGYMISLFKNKKSLVGYLRYFDGPCADPPYGVIEDITYAPSTENISFIVRFSDRVNIDASKPTDRAAVKFTGKVSHSKLEGTFSFQEMSTGKLVSEKYLKLQAITLNKTCHDCMSYDEWDKYAKDRKDHLGW